MSENDVLAELIQIIERGLFKDWLEAGRAFRQIRDERLHEPLTFGSWVESTFGCHRSVAYDRLQAADVADSLAASGHPDIALTLSHATLLGRFTDETRVELAPKIARLPYRQAENLVRARGAAEPKTLRVSRRAPTDVGRVQLSRLGNALRTIRDLDFAALESALSRLDPHARGDLDREMTAVARRLMKLRRLKDVALGG